MRHKKDQLLFAAPESVAAWTSLFPGLLWSVEVPRSRLEIIKPWRHPFFGDETPRLLKEAAFLRKHILPEDLLPITEFWEAMAARIPASALFRLARDEKNWLFLQGWPGQDDNWFYHGLLQPAPEYIVPEAAPPGTDLWPQCRSVANYPVLLINPESGDVVARNQEAVLLLGRDPIDPALPFDSLLPPEAVDTARQALATAANEGVWGGALTFKLSNGMTINSETRLTVTPTHGNRLARLSFLKTAGQRRRAAGAERPAPDSPAGELVRKISRAPTLRAALELMLASHEPHAFDGILYSDIHADKGHVTVYGAGKPDIWAQTFAYEGTIAQNIERHGLNYLVVDDTLDSIKSIDWVLFVPRGIRSYFARPFYRRNQLKAILILCSVHPGAFSLAAAERYEVLAPAFAGAVFRAKPNA